MINVKEMIPQTGSGKQKAGGFVHNAIMANSLTSLGVSSAFGAGAGAAIGAVNGGLSYDGSIVGGAVSGAITGGLGGAAFKGVSGTYALGANKAGLQKNSAFKWGTFKSGWEE